MRLGVVSGRGSGLPRSSGPGPAEEPEDQAGRANVGSLSPTLPGWGRRWEHARAGDGAHGPALVLPVNTSFPLLPRIPNPSSMAWTGLNLPMDRSEAQFPHLSRVSVTFALQKCPVGQGEIAEVIRAL